MPDDLADDLNSMSFGSSDRSGSETISTVSTGSGSGPVDPGPDAVPPTKQPAGTAAGGDGPRRRLALDDIRFVQRLGSGDIGSVYLAELKCADPEGCILAGKVMDKKELEGRHKEGRARTEREILEMLDHPFLPRLYGVAENDRWSCLLTEFCPGGDLHVLRQRQPGKRFDEPAARFYASEVVVALEYLHMLGIVYRDLKPENVLVRSDGHIMLTDFDLSLKSDAEASPSVHLVSNRSVPSAQGSVNPPPSCILPRCIVPSVSCFHPKSKRRRKPSHRNAGGLEFIAEPVGLRSMSFVGTHEYLAPEIVSGEGHGSTVDWWTLGVFVFELLYGFTPFKGSDNEMTLANIVARALEFPKDPPVSSSMKDLVAGLLAKDPARRTGATSGATAVKRHPFFGNVNWALLRCTSPPHIPAPFSRRSSSREVSEDGSGPGTPVEYY